MHQIETPPPLPVKALPVDLGPNGQDGYTPVATLFFRHGSLLPESLMRARERQADESTMVVVSAGCSIGAEADSILALHRMSANGGRIAIKGVDINSGAIESARRGEYYTPKIDGSLSYPDDKYDVFSGVGINVDQSKTYNIKGASLTMPHYRVDVAELRQDQEIEFARTDLRKTPAEVSANLITANNMLYHLDPARASRVVANLATMLSEQGILSVGDTGDLAMGPAYVRFPRGRVVRYHDWLSKVSRQLSAKFGLKTIATGTYGQPTMFART